MLVKGAPGVDSSYFDNIDSRDSQAFGMKI